MEVNPRVAGLLYGKVASWCTSFGHLLSKLRVIQKKCLAHLENKAKSRAKSSLCMTMHLLVELNARFAGRLNLGSQVCFMERLRLGLREHSVD